MYRLSFKGSGILASLLFLIFVIAITRVLLQNLSVTDCGCASFLYDILDALGFAVSTAPNWKIVFTDVILAVVSLCTVCSPQRGYGLDLIIQQMK